MLASTLLINDVSRLTRLLLSSVLLSQLLACGGGGGDSDSSASAPVGPTNFAVERVFPALSFDEITNIQSQAYPAAASSSGDRIFVVEQAGRIRVFDNTTGADSSEVFLDISDRVTSSGSEQGLLGLAFHPEFDTNGFFYLHYTVQTNSIPQRVRISRFSVPDMSGAPNTADPSSEQIVLVVDQAAEGPASTNHNGGSVAFSPVDGFLYISVGDGGGANDPNGNGQDLSTLSGSMLRIDVDAPTGSMNYSVPADNPFIAQSGARGEIYAYGLRNPFKATFDNNGDLWIGDVGQDALEEVNFLGQGDNSGANFGWDCREGTRAGEQPTGTCFNTPRSAFVDPVDQYSQQGSQSITGGFVYRGSALPSLIGRYVYGDFISGVFWAYDPGSGQTETLAGSDLGVSTFGQTAAGELLIGDFFGGGLYRLVPSSAAE